MTELRQLDRLVAEHVMGWAYWDGEDDWRGPDNVTCWADGDPYLAVYTPEGGSDPAFYFSPSSSIADAWLVVERMRERCPKGTFSVGVSYAWGPGGWEAEFFDGKRSFSSFRALPSEAICRAALAALGVEVPT